MSVRSKWIIGLIIVICLLVGYSFITYVEGNRLSAIAAAKAQSSIGKDATIFGQVEFPWGEVFLLHTPNGDRTAVVRKNGLFWFCNYVTTLDHHQDSDPIRTVGWLNYQYTGANPTEEVSLIAVVTNDPKVKTIEVGEGTDRVRKPIEKNTPLIVWWPKAFIGSSLNPVAFVV